MHMSISQEVKELQDQFRLLHERYKDLVQRSDAIGQNLSRKQVQTNIFKREVNLFTQDIYEKLQDVNKELIHTTNLHDKVSRKFSNVVKIGRAEKVRLRIENQNYENLIGRKEFKRMIKRRL